MCLAVPMKIVEIQGGRARCTALEQERWADLSLMSDPLPKTGEYVIIHLGFVQRTVTAAEAQESYALFGEILDALEATERQAD